MIVHFSIYSLSDCFFFPCSCDKHIFLRRKNRKPQMEDRHFYSVFLLYVLRMQHVRFLGQLYPTRQVGILDMWNSYAQRVKQQCPSRWVAIPISSDIRIHHVKYLFLLFNSNKREKQALLLFFRTVKIPVSGCIIGKYENSFRFFAFTCMQGGKNGTMSGQEIQSDKK